MCENFTYSKGNEIGIGTIEAGLLENAIINDKVKQSRKAKNTKLYLLSTPQLWHLVCR